MNLEDAERFKIEEGEVVQASTLKGRSLKMKVNFSSRLSSGVITTSFPCLLIGEGGISSGKVEKVTKGNEFISNRKMEIPNPKLKLKK